RRQRRRDEHAGNQRERHRHAHVAEHEEQYRHQAKDRTATHRRYLGSELAFIFRRAAAIEHLRNGDSDPDLTPSANSAAGRSSRSSGPSKPLRIPLTSCSSVNRKTRTPAAGTIAVYTVSGISDGIRKLPRSSSAFFQPNHVSSTATIRTMSRLGTS